jgi:UDP-glucose 6-dehydrogenase
LYMQDATTRPTIGIIGIGTVGDAYLKYFLSQGFKRGETLFCYDNNPAKGYSDDITKADIYIVCVSTPSRADGACDTGAVERAVATQARAGCGFAIVSTVPPGTTERLQQQHPDAFFCRVPEFLREASAYTDLIRPTRQIIAPTAKSKAFAKTLQQLLPKARLSAPGPWGNFSELAPNAAEAEMTKCANNLFGALKVVFANVVCDVVAFANQEFGSDAGTDMEVSRVLALIAGDPRISDAWFGVRQNGYRGFGGPCFPKDFRAFMAAFRKSLAAAEKRAYASADTDIGVGKAALAYLEAAYRYNEELLRSQGLSMQEVSAAHYNNHANDVREQTAE